MDEEFKAFFKRVTGNEGERCHYPTRLDTYGRGCEHNCGYCYAKSLLDFRKLWNPAQPAIANVNRIRHTVRTKLHKGEIVRLGGMTDCFQPIELNRRITYYTIKALNDMGVGYLIVTKGGGIIDRPEYMELMDRSLAHIQVSVTSTDATVSKKMEAGAPVPEARFRAIETLQNEGFDVSVRLSPFIPELVDLSVIDSIQCDKILVEFLRVNTWIERWLTNLNLGINLERYTLKSAGYRHLPLDEKISLALRAGKTFKELTVCEDVEEHWNYWREYINANPEDCCNLKK